MRKRNRGGVNVGVWVMGSLAKGWRAASVRVVAFAGMGPIRLQSRRSFGPLAWYNRQLQRSPVITKCITSGGEELVNRPPYFPSYKYASDLPMYVLSIDFVMQYYLEQETYWPRLSPWREGASTTSLDSGGQ